MICRWTTFSKEKSSTWRGIVSFLSPGFRARSDVTDTYFRWFLVGQNGMSFDFANPSAVLAGAADVAVQLTFTIAAIFLIRSPSFLKGFLLFTCFPPLFYFSVLLFTKVVRSSEVTHLGFHASVVIPLVLFWGSLAIIGLDYIYAIFAGIKKTSVALFAIVVVRLAYALAYGSRIGGILTGVDFTLALIAIVVLCKAKLKEVEVSQAPGTGQTKVKDE
jgi:hypothetical protein